MDINETHDKVIQYRKIITETSKRRDVFEEKIAKFGELHALTHVVVEYNDAIAGSVIQFSRCVPDHVLHHRG